MDAVLHHERLPPANADADLWNADLAPVLPEQRTWDWKSFTALWVSMVVCVPTYLLAGGLIAEGMAWWQAVLTVFLGNLIVLAPIVLIGHAGTKYGVPFPVLLRSAFGTHGAKVPAMMRALVACGWFGINTWVGGSAIYVIVNTLSGGVLKGAALPVLGIDPGQTLCFIGFWVLHLYFIHYGTESIRRLEALAAPFLIVMSLALLGWAYVTASGFDAMFAMQSAFVPGGPKAGQFWPVFGASLTAMVGFWSTMALNIPDFTRFARQQSDQMIGQAIGLPVPMALFAFMSVAVTGATVTIYGAAIWDPVALANRMGGIAVVLALAALLVATLTINMAANLVGPAYDFSNLAPRRISFRMGGYITAGIGIAIFPWKLIESAGTYLFTWLVGYSALLGPIAGILIVDYYFIRRRQLDVDELFRHAGRYGGSGGWNLVGLGALAAGILPCLPGFLHAIKLVPEVPPVFDLIYTYAWFVGLAVAAAVYFVAARRS